MTNNIHNGSCQCGSTQYSIKHDDVKTVVCHCTGCQKQSASAFGAVMIVPADAVTLTKGSLEKWTRTADSGNKVHCYFCGTCGSRIWHGDKETEAMLKVRAGTLETPINYAQATHIWTRSKAPGIEIPAGANSFETQPG
jgi:hypothetical protein